MSSGGIGAEGSVNLDLEAALEIIESTRGLSFLERFKLLGLDPKINLAGGDWRNCDFSLSDVREADFRNSRLFHANFRSALVEGADFRGAGDVHTAKIHLAIGWRDATFDDYQIVLIESHIDKMRSYQDQIAAHRAAMSEKQWFYAIKACPSFSEAKQVLEQMEAAGYRLNAYAYSYILDRAKRDRKTGEGWAMFNQFVADGGQPDAAMYTAGIGVAPDGNSALTLFDTLSKSAAEIGVLPDERAYNMVISRQGGNISQALRLFRDMNNQGVPISRHTIYALFDSCKSFANAVTVLMEARKSGVDINDKSFVDELLNTRNYPDLDRNDIDKWKNDGLSDRQVIIRLVQNTLKDPYLSSAMIVLNNT